MIGFPVSPSIIVSTITLKIFFHCEAAKNGDFGFIWLASFYNTAPYFIAGGGRPKSATWEPSPSHVAHARISISFSAANETGPLIREAK